MAAGGWIREAEKMRGRARLYRVICCVNEHPVERSVMAETLPLACGIAENHPPKGFAVHVTIEVDIIGRCRKCGSFIEGDDRFQRRRDDTFLCVDCL